MNFKQYHDQNVNEDGDGGDGGYFSGDTPSNTPGMGNPSPGGASGDVSSSDFGSGDTWGFATLFPNYKKNSKKKKTVKKKKRTTGK
jgi:hypothetical protein